MKFGAKFRRPRVPEDISIGAGCGSAPTLRKRTYFDTRTARQVDMAARAGIAILPFTDLAPQSDHPYLADGFARDLAQILSLNPSFAAECVTDVHNETATRGAPVKIVQPLLLEGALRRNGRRLIAMMRMVETASGDILWADRFASELDRIAAMQDEIAEAIAGAISSTPYFLAPDLTPVGTHSTAAWALRRAARFVLDVGPDPASLDGAVRLFTHSAALDPGYANAKVGLAETLTLRLLLLSSPAPGEDRIRCAAVTESCRNIAPRHAELNFVRGMMELDSGNSPDAVRLLKRAARITGIAVPARIFLGIARARSGRAQLAREDAALAIRRAGRPGWAALADYAKAEALLARGDWGDAEAALDTAAQVAEAPPVIHLLYSLVLAERGAWELSRKYLAALPPDMTRPGRDALERWISALPAAFSQDRSWLQLAAET